MTIATVTRPLDRLTWDGLAAAYCAAEDDSERAAIVAAAQRLERTEAAAAKRAQSRALERARYQDAMHAQFLAAEAACNGVLVNADGMRAVLLDPATGERGPIGLDALWQDARARAKYASEELRNWFDDNPPLTFRQWQATSRAAEHRAWQDAREREAEDARDLQHRAHVARAPQRPPVPAPRPAGPPIAPGSIARLTAALRVYGAQVDNLTARALAARGRILAGGTQR